MKQVFIELDDGMLAELDRIAPGRTRKRSAFIRAAIRQALDEAAERQMAEAYRAQPDVRGDEGFDPDAWAANADWAEARRK